MDVVDLQLAEMSAALSKLKEAPASVTLASVRPNRPCARIHVGKPRAEVIEWLRANGLKVSERPDRGRPGTVLHVFNLCGCEVVWHDEG